MNEELQIEHTEHAWNPVTGCTRISPGCDQCYAEVMVNRLQKAEVHGYGMGFSITVHRPRMSQPLTRQQPTVYFVSTLGDLFHPEVPDEILEEVLTVMERAPDHKFHVLTKRSERLPGYFETRHCPANLRIGVSVEDRAHLNRIEHLRQVNAPVRFVYFEPLLEDMGSVNLNGIDWVVIGGEAGVGARAMHPNWGRGIINQARRLGLPAHMRHIESGDGVLDRGENGRVFRGRTWNAYFDIPPAR